MKRHKFENDQFWDKGKPRKREVEKGQTLDYHEQQQRPSGIKNAQTYQTVHANHCFGEEQIGIGPCVIDSAAQIPHTNSTFNWGRRSRQRYGFCGTSERYENHDPDKWLHEVNHLPDLDQKGTPNLRRTEGFTVSDAEVNSRLPFLPDFRAATDSQQSSRRDSTYNPEIRRESTFGFLSHSMQPLSQNATTCIKCKISNDYLGAIVHTRLQLGVASSANLPPAQNATIEGSFYSNPSRKASRHTQQKTSNVMVTSFAGCEAKEKTKEEGSRIKSGIEPEKTSDVGEVPREECSSEKEGQTSFQREKKNEVMPEKKSSLGASPSQRAMFHKHGSVSSYKCELPAVEERLVGDDLPKRSPTFHVFLKGEVSHRRHAVCQEIEKTMNLVKVNGSRISLYDLRKDLCRLVDDRVFKETACKGK